jgi:hypothetical protein
MALAASLWSTLLSIVPLRGCLDLDSDLGKRFREGYAPGLVDGLSAAITDPAEAETGFRQAGVALIDAIGALLQPRTPSSAGSDSGS